MALTEKEKIIAQRLDHLITSNPKITAKLVAEGIGSNESSVSMWRNGHRTIPPTMLYKIADFFKIPVSTLLGEDEQSENAILGQKIESLRKKKDIDYVTFAKQTDITPIELSKIERGFRKPTPDEYKRIVAALGMDLNTFQIDYEKYLQEIRSICKVLGVSEDTTNLITSEIEYDLFKRLK